MERLIVRRCPNRVRIGRMKGSDDACISSVDAPVRSSRPNSLRSEVYNANGAMRYTSFRSRCCLAAQPRNKVHTTSGVDGGPESPRRWNVTITSILVQHLSREARCRLSRVGSVSRRRNTELNRRDAVARLSVVSEARVTVAYRSSTPEVTGKARAHVYSNVFL